VVLDELGQAFLDAEGATTWDRNLGGALQRFAAWIRSGEHWRELQTEPHIYDAFSDQEPPAMTDQWKIIPGVRIPIGSRLRIFSDVLASMQEVQRGASTMRQRKQFRLAMEKRKRRRLRVWPARENMR
jgi:hypothetical protein